MKERNVEQQLRSFLLIVAAFVCAGTLMELWLTGHRESVVQYIPYFLSVLALCAVGVVWFVPKRSTLLALRWIMAVVLLGGMYGSYEHYAGNVAFAAEINPGLTGGTLFWDSLSGATPLLAPGILTLSALLAIAATYRHPALEKP